MFSKHSLLDTNILIGIINGQINPVHFDFHNAVVSALTVMELYALSGVSNIEEQQIDTAVSRLVVIPVNANIARRAGRLARTRKKGRIDLFLAATAIEFGIPLITRNIKDFKNIPGLVLKKPGE